MTATADKPSAASAEKPNGPLEGGPVPSPNAVTADQVRRAFETGKYPYTRKLSRRAYEAEK